MQSVGQQSTAAAARQRRARSNNDLVSLSAPLVRLSLKLRAGLVTPSADLRASFERMLEEVEERGATLRYDRAQLHEVRFALAAFVDEMVLSEYFPLREQWEKYPLQLKYFGEHLAGVKFFERLDALLGDVEAQADVVEVYYLCLLLGYKGQYKIFQAAQLKAVIENTAEQLRRAGRLRDGHLSLRWKATDQPGAPPREGWEAWAKVGGFGLCALLLLYVLLGSLLSSDLRSAKEMLLR